MENATKFLIIAGAILIAIVLISVGMMLVNGAQGTIDEGLSQMSQQEKQIFNRQFTSYEGETVKGSTVKGLIETIVASNNNNSDKVNREVTITTSIIDDDGLDASDLANYDGTSTDVIQAFTQAASKLKNKINTGNTYTVTVDTNAKTGLVKNVNIDVYSAD